MKGELVDESQVDGSEMNLSDGEVRILPPNHITRLLNADIIARFVLSNQSNHEIIKIEDDGKSQK